MRLENRSKTLLAITKAKAKMYEFNVDEEFHIDLANNPENLLFLTIGILGDVAAIISTTPEAEIPQHQDYIDSKQELSSVSQYFDALDHSLLTPDLSYFLHLAGATSFYLCDMPGSSFVLTKKINIEEEPLVRSSLDKVLAWLLSSDINQPCQHLGNSFQGQLDALIEAYRNYFNRRGNEEVVYSVLSQLKLIVYGAGSDLELFLIDAIAAVAKVKIINSSIKCLPRFTGLDLNLWNETLNRETFIKEFWPAQKLLGQSGIFSGTSSVIQLPTSAGKTKSTELIIRSGFLSQRAKVVVLVAPFRALCREITSTFQSVFSGEPVTLNELQDIPSISDEENDFIRFLLGRAREEVQNTIIISTPEKLVYLLRHEPRLSENIDLLIFDEGHQFDTGTRGVTYELLIASLKQTVPAECQIILISAVMANANSIGDWLYGEDGTEIYGNRNLPTVRNIAFTSWTHEMGQLQYIDNENVQDRNYFVPRVIRTINLGKRGRERRDRIFPVKEDNSSLSAYLALKVCHQGPVAVFCGVKSTVTTIAEAIVDCYDRNLPMPRPSASSDELELNKIAALADLHYGANSVYSKAIVLGALPHSSNIPNGIRVSVEWAMENGKACLVICTSTLAQGVNLPIRYLIVSSTYQAGREISTRDFHNLIGRAGRAGYHTEGNIIFSDINIYDKRFDRRESWRWRNAQNLLDFNNAEHCLSSLKTLIEPFEYAAMNINIVQYLMHRDDYQTLCIETAERNQYATDILKDEFNRKDSILEAVESYLLAFLKDNPDVTELEDFIRLAEGTLAYHLSDDAEKGLLVFAFQQVATRILAIDSEKYPYYGKALIGLKDLQHIETWIDENRFEIELTHGYLDLLNVSWSLLLSVSKNKFFSKFRAPEFLLTAANLWITGSSYNEILNYLTNNDCFIQAGTQRRNLKIDHVIEFADNVLGFDLMMIVGALADILEGHNFSEEIVENSRFLQSCLKFGLNDELQFWLYKKGYVDREVCKLLASRLVELGVRPNSIDYELISRLQPQIDQVLAGLPSYFSEI